jgi:hypothetical protein
MFTFGIFSTHLPYIAFVVFYALIFVSGTGNSDNARAAAKIKSTKHEAGNSVCHLDETVIADFHADDFIPDAALKKREYFPVADFLFLDYTDDSILSGGFVFSLCVRPPPVRWL